MPSLLTLVQSSSSGDYLGPKTAVGTDEIPDAIKSLRDLMRTFSKMAPPGLKDRLEPGESILSKSMSSRIFRTKLVESTMGELKKRQVSFNALLGPNHPDYVDDFTMSMRRGETKVVL